MDALGLRRRSLTVFAHTLPAASGIDGLLGLDFFQGTKLSIDFVAGTIEVEAP
jgi:hypothetical protein